MSRSLIFLLLAFATSSVQAEASKTTLTPSEVAKLATRTFVLWECAALASEAAQEDDMRALFNAGLSEGRRFISESESRQADTAALNAIFKQTPLIISMNLGGPSTDFVLGNIWGAVMIYADDEIEDRETWTHQKNHPTAEASTNQALKMKAVSLYRERNCAHLLR